ncbi:MAG: winged helix-turn-helix domain-containing protein [Proteobacteria bacterium]|nr:winged helix-turn-helix domain-containing protein [Pseudomonadota bacterium]
MPTEEELQEGFTLGDWDILPGKGVFRRGDQEERPEPKVFAVLIALAKRDTNLVTKQELIDEVWDGRPTADEPITRCVYQLRRHLDDSENRQLVETLQRRGYRLKQRVELHQRPDPVPAPVPETGPNLRRWKPMVAFLAVAIVAIVWFIGPPGPETQPQQLPPPVKSIAVLPFENLSGVEDDEYIVSAFQFALVQALHGMKDFIVKRSRVRYEMESEEIAKLLGVESVLIGSMQRDGNILKISYEISKRGEVVFSETVDGTAADLFSLQEKLSKTVRSDLGDNLSPALIKGHRPESDAYDSYMRGMYALERRGDPGNLEQSIELFETAIRRDDHYGPSYLALATAYALMVDYRHAPLEEMNRRARETVEQGIKLDPIIEDAAGAIYGYVYHKEKRWAESEQAYFRAVNADVVDSNAFNWYSRMLASVGRLDDALELVQRAVKIDPSSGLLNSRLALAYTWVDDRKNAYEYFTRSKDLGWGGSTHLIGYALLLARDGQIDKARNETISGIKMFGARTDWIDPLFAAMADSSLVPEALQALDVAADERQVEPFIEFVARAILGDLDGAMGVARLLEQPGEIFEMDLLFIPELRALRQHPEFMPLLERLKVLDYWESAGCEWSGDSVTCGADLSSKN